MLLQNYTYEIELKRRDLDRQIRHKRLVALALAGRDHLDSHMFVRLGAWLVLVGRNLESRYSLPEPAVIPTKSTVNAR